MAYLLGRERAERGGKPEGWFYPRRKTLEGGRRPNRWGVKKVSGPEKGRSSTHPPPKQRNVREWNSDEKTGDLRKTVPPPVTFPPSGGKAQDQKHPQTPIHTDENSTRAIERPRAKKKAETTLAWWLRQPEAGNQQGKMAQVVELRPEKRRRQGAKKPPNGQTPAGKLA